MYVGKKAAAEALPHLSKEKPQTKLHPW